MHAQHDRLESRSCERLPPTPLLLALSCLCVKHLVRTSIDTVPETLKCKFA